jgi:DNA-binding transcriptional LysR family regulator
LKREADLAFFTVGTPVHADIEVRSIDRKELVILMAPTHPLTAMDPIPVRQLRGVPMIAVSAGVNDAVIAACTSWLARHLDEDPNFVAHEPPDQLAEAVVNREDAVTFISDVGASAAGHLGLVYRRLAPSPMLGCGVAYRKDNRSAALADLLEIIDELAVPPPADPTAFENLSA